MRPFIPAPNAVLIEVLGNQNGQPCEFTCGAVKGSAYSLANLVTLAGAIDGWVNTDLLSLIASDVTYEGVTIRGLSSEADFRYDLSEPLPGGAEAAAIPAQTALVVTKRTGLTGRSQRGRLYVWGLSADSLLDTRHMTSTYVAAYQTAFDNFLAAVVTGGFAAAVISYRTGGAWRTTAQIKPITAMDVRDNRLDTQRRRVGSS